MLRTVKKQIENDFLEAAKQAEVTNEKKIKNDENLEYNGNKIIIDDVKVRRRSKPKKIIVEWDNKLKSKAKTKKATKHSW